MPAASANAETHALADAADMAILLQHDLYDFHGKRIPITLLTDSKSMFDLIAKGSMKTEKRLMIDVKATRQAYDEEVVNSIGWIRREGNLSESLTKIAVS